MPELPDLEIYAENLRLRVQGRAIELVEVYHPRVLGRIEKAAFMDLLRGRSIRDVIRRGKTLGFLLDSGDRLDVHLMLTGEIYFAEAGKPLGAPCPVLGLFFNDDSRLVFSDVHYDPRRPLDPKMWIALNKNERFGIDPLDPSFTSSRLAEICRRTKIAPIKALLMDQKLIAGLGNAYADEILWEARIRPRHPASLLTGEQINALHHAIGVVLTEALARVREGLQGEVHGEIRDFLKVHHRGSKPCPRCGMRVAQESLRGRATNWCPSCQP
jgi:formamidopyrimidine-DNA glycosylase